jgi:ABC-type uncharacterized transport system permease subunit
MYEIPKEIKSKVKIFGLEMKEIVIVMISLLFIFSVFKDMVHGLFEIPYYIVSICLLLWCLIPSSNNPGVKNYMSIYFLFKKSRFTYHSLDIQELLNKIVFYKQDEGER